MESALDRRGVWPPNDLKGNHIMTIKTKTPANEEEPRILLRPENHPKQYEALFLDIDSGRIKLPMFQREFVWDKEQTAKLIDSILKGYPIGTFILWKTRDKLRSYKEIGHHKLPETPDGDYAEYILDGQQRITSLYAIRKGLRITKDGKEIDYRDIFVNLDYDAKTDEQIAITQKEEGKDCVPVHDLLTKKMQVLFKGLTEEKAELVEDYKNKLTTYDFPTITIKDYPIEIACDVFTRINTGGKPLSLFEIMVAMTYDEKKGFDLALKYDELCYGTEETVNYLEKAKYETIPTTTVMQSVAVITVNSVRAKDILKIRRENFIENWKNMESSMFTAINFLRTTLRIPVSQLLPYPSLLVPLVYFFHKNNNQKPNSIQAKRLEQFFYWVSLTTRYSSATETKIGEDLKKMDLIVRGRKPRYSSEELKINADEIADTWFSAGNSFVKAILCLFASQKPRNFDDDADVLLDNSHLKIASSKNYHHFFPKEYLRKHAPGEQANLVANITLIDAASNNKIKAKAPSVYIGKFLENNKQLSNCLKTHFIGNLNRFGILNNDYQAFIKHRSAAIANALNDKLNPVFKDA
jgi:hypothetical protein